MVGWFLRADEVQRERRQEEEGGDNMPKVETLAVIGCLVNRVPWLQEARCNKFFRTLKFGGGGDAWVLVTGFEF
ncbi:hypothetical protein SUGI_0821050 [Cryptomeria japonica]|nr:hypothetical protein SUGI_0821050 [Cryptomeria japonica]